MNKLTAATASVLLIAGLTACTSTAPEVETATQEAPPATSAPAETTEAPAPAPEPTTEAPAPETPTVGVPFPVETGQGTAQITIVTAESVDALTGPLATPSENGRFLVLDVLWETLEGTTSANPFYFEAKDSEGRAAEMELFADGLLGSGDVPTGDKMRGFIVFDVAPGPVTVTITDALMQEAARVEIAG